MTATSTSAKTQRTSPARRSLGPGSLSPAVVPRDALRGVRANYVDIESLQSLATVDQLLSTFITNGPVVSRMASSGSLTEPSFSITLQRDSLDIGGNVGMLSLGALPPGVTNASLQVSRPETTLMKSAHVFGQSGFLSGSIHLFKVEYLPLLLHQMRLVSCLIHWNPD